MKRDLISIADLSPADIEEIFSLARALKDALKAGRPHHLLAGKTMAMIFEKPSLRTRLTFEVGMVQLGGYAVYLAPQDIGLGERESVADIAHNLERWVDVIMVRSFSHRIPVELASTAAVPVINGLSDLLHPCQVLTDCFTVLEKKGKLEGVHIAFVGDGNNVAHSWMEAAMKLPFRFSLACPPGIEPDADIFERAQAMSDGRVAVTHSVEEAVRDADVIYTDAWTSMGQEREAGKRRRIFRPYQVNRTVLSWARKEVVVMHCLPAHRGEEIADEVIDGPHSVVFDQAENRLHVQKGLLVWLLKDKGIGLPTWEPGQ